MDEDKFKEAMKKVYGSNRPTNSEKIEEELDDIGEDTEQDSPELQEKLNDVKDILGKKHKNEVRLKPKSQTKEDKQQDKKETAALPKKETQKELTVSANPHIKDTISINIIMWSVILALLPATIAGVYFFKYQAFLIILVSVITAALTELVILKLTNKPITLDGSSIITGLLLALILPPTVPLWLPILGAIFAISIGKMIFGGLGHNIFNPALIGRSFLMAAFPALMATYITPDGVTGATPLGLWKEQAITTSYSQLFFGNVGGSIGETSALALLIGAVLLFFPPLLKYKQPIIDWRIPTMYLGTVFVVAILFRQDVLFHLLAGGLLIGAFFMATDYVTGPITKTGRLVFGFGCGFLTMVLRLFSTYPEGVMFSILLMNAATPLIDRFTKPKPFGAKKKSK